MTPTTASCSSNVLVRLPPGYQANDSIFNLSMADAAGMVLSPIVEPALFSDPDKDQKYPDSIYTIDMAGNLSRIWSDTSGVKMPVSVVADANNVYFLPLGLVGYDLVSVPRAGGQPTVLVDGSVRTLLTMVGGKIYYGGLTSDFHDAVFELDVATGIPTLLSDRGDMSIEGMTADAVSVYWTESDGDYSSGADFILYKLSLADKSVVKLGGLSPKAGIDELMLAGDTLYVSGIVGITFPLSRVVPGGAPVVVVSETSGAIAITQDTAYYGSRSGGITQTPLDFSVTTPVPGTSSIGYLSTVAVGPQHVWYASGGCIYRMPR